MGMVDTTSIIITTLTPTHTTIGLEGVCLLPRTSVSLGMPLTLRVLLPLLVLRARAGGLLVHLA